MTSPYRARSVEVGWRYAEVGFTATVTAATNDIQIAPLLLLSRRAQYSTSSKNGAPSTPLGLYSFPKQNSFDSRWFARTALGCQPQLTLQMAPESDLPSL